MRRPPRLTMPSVGYSALRILSPLFLELEVIVNEKLVDPAPLTFLEVLWTATIT